MKILICAVGALLGSAVHLVIYPNESVLFSVVSLFGVFCCFAFMGESR